MSQRSKKAIKILLVGSTGRMGQEILALVKTSKEFKCTYQMSSQNSAWSDVDAKNIDIVIDFSSPHAFTEALRWTTQHKKAFLSGTTGLSEAQFRQLKSSAKKIPVLWASNMSLGIAVLRLFMANMAPLNKWQFQIEEAHHRHKKDKPSGTALTLQSDLSAAVGKKLPPIISIRGGGVPGIHKISARSADEVITIEHTAINRRVFARGALVAARWLFDKKRAGLYDLGNIQVARN